MVNLVFDNEWLFCVEAKARKCREWRGFIKHVEVADGKLLVDCFGHFESCLLLLADIVALAKLDRTRASFAFNCKYNIVR